MKHPSQWREALTIDLNELEVRELVNGVDITKDNPLKTVKDWQKLYDDCDAIQRICESVIAKLDN